AVVMLQDNNIAVATLMALERDNPIGGGMDGSARRRGVVNTGVTAPVAVDRVLAHAESGTDAGELQGVSQKRPLQARAVKVIVAARLAVRCEPYGFIGLAAVDEFQCQDAPGADFTAFVGVGFVHNAEPVAAA